MGTNSDNLALQLSELRFAGHTILPGLARSYSQASRDLHNTGFYRDREAPAMGAIVAFNDLLQDLMVASFGNLMNNGRALVEIAEQYACTDARAARELARLWDERMAAEAADPMPPAGPVPPPKPASLEEYEVEKRTVTVQAPDGTGAVADREVTVKVPLR